MNYVVFRFDKTILENSLSRLHSQKNISRQMLQSVPKSLRNGPRPSQASQRDLQTSGTFLRPYDQAVCRETNVYDSMNPGEKQMFPI